MNLKPNIWTLLFLITAGALIYVVSTNTNKTQNSITPPNEIYRPDDQLDSALAWKMITKYFNNYIVPSMYYDTFDINNIGLENPAVYFTKLDSNEIRQIAETFDGKNVYIIPVIKERNQQSVGKDTLDFIFADISPLDSNSQVQATFFDFSKPCPPMCPWSDTSSVNGSQ